jgi:DtxR family Mn-dependent transcriptional regulator
MKKNLTESLEKYLYAIYDIVKVNKAARVKDVANYLKIGAPATSDAVKVLANRGYINYVPYGIITITAKGRKKAEEKIYRHKIISDFLERVLMLEPEKVEDNATKIEFGMPEDVLEKFLQLLSFMDKCSCKEPKWVTSFHYYVQNGKLRDKCSHCMKSEGDIACCCEKSCNSCQ